MRRTTELLARLEKLALDEQRIVVQALEAELGIRQCELATAERALATEHVITWKLPGGPRHLAGYAARMMERQRHLRRDASAVADALVLARRALQDRLQTYKAMEEADSRRVARDEATMLRRNQAEADEAGALRRATGPVAGRSAA